MISRTNRLIIYALVSVALTSTQSVKIKIVAPKAWNDRKALLLTREKGFAAVVHSIRLGFDTTHLMMDSDLLPDLYQFQVSQKKGGIDILLRPGHGDTAGYCQPCQIDGESFQKQRRMAGVSNTCPESFGSATECLYFGGSAGQEAPYGR